MINPLARSTALRLCRRFSLKNRASTKLAAAA
jgi:hypothetical protein